MDKNQPSKQGNLGTTVKAALWSRSRHCSGAVHDRQHLTRTKAHSRHKIARATVVQPFIHQQTRNHSAGKRFGHGLKSWSVINRRAVSVLQQRLSTMAKNRQPGVAGFNNVAAAAQRFCMDRQKIGCGKGEIDSGVDQKLHCVSLRIAHPAVNSYSRPPG